MFLQAHFEFRSQARKNVIEACVFDWSSMQVELYNFHTVAARVPPSPVTRALPESSGARFATAICRSWNSGRCICLRPTCRYLHVCDTPRSHCPTQTPNPPAAPPSLLSLPPSSSGVSHSLTKNPLQLN